MPDREKVIKGIQECDLNGGLIGNCPYKEIIELLKEQQQEIWELQDQVEYLTDKLKEQEAVKPHYNARTNWYECGSCKFSMTSGMHCRGELIPAYKVGFCAKCGRKQEWE